MQFQYRPYRRWTAAAIAAVSALFSAAQGQSLQDWMYEQKVVASDSTAYSDFGYAVDASESRIVFGAQERAYIFEKPQDTWIETARVTSTGTYPGDDFGMALAISGDRLVIGAPTNDVAGTNAGIAYVFEFDGVNWQQVQVLLPGAGGDLTQAEFGSAVEVEGDRVVVSAPFLGPAGSVHVFDRSPAGVWEEAVITGDAGGFGEVLSLDGNRLAIGSSGGCLVYEFDGVSWTEVASIGIPESDAVGFGNDLALSGGRLAISAVTASPQSTGAVYVFGGGSGDWSLWTKVVGADCDWGYYFGQSVDLEGERMIVGAKNGTGDWLYTGAAYVFDFQNGYWVQVAKHVPSSPDSNDHFGWSVACEGDLLAVGAPYGDPGGMENVGSAYIYGIEHLRDPVTGQFYNLVNEALGDLAAGGRLEVRSPGFGAPYINLAGKAIEFYLMESLTLPEDLMLFLSDATTFINVGGNASVVSSADVYFPEDGQVIIDGSLFNTDSGLMFLDDTTLIVDDYMATWGSSTSYLSGTIVADTVWTNNSGTNAVHADTMVLANYLNQATTVVHRGVLNIVGDLTNTGTMLGDVDTGPGFRAADPPMPGDGFSIGGDYALAADASVHMRDFAWTLRVGGDFDVAIDNPARFTMDGAVLSLTGLGGSTQSVELLSADLGEGQDGFDASNFPIGTVHVASGATVRCVDQHSNTGSGQAETLYAEHLIVEPNGHLELTNGSIYVRTADIQGQVDGDVIVIPDGPACSGDVTGNGEVDINDVLLVLSDFGCTSNCEADVTEDGVVNIDDVLVVLSDFGGCGS